MEDDNNASSKRNKYGIIPFAGNDFENWLFRIETVLEENNLWEEAFGEDEKKQDAKNFAKCRSIIIQCIADSHLEYIKDCATPKLMLEKIRKTFEKKGIASQLLIRKKLLTLKYSGNGGLEEHFRNYDKLIRQLKSTGAKPDEMELVCGLLLTLPSSFNNVVTAIETIQNAEQLTLEFVKKRLLDEELKVIYREPESESFVTRRPPKGKAFPFECYGCGKIGHKKEECRFRNNKRTFKKKYGHSAQEEDENKLSFITETTATAATLRNGKGRIEFIVDSGATDHIINDDMYLTEVEILKPEININTARKGDKIEATKKGKIECENGITIKNVLYAPKLRCNLLSISKMEKAGLRIEFGNTFVKIYHEKELIKQGVRENNLYKVNFNVQTSKEEEHKLYAQKAYCIKESQEEWHRRLGHASQEKLRILKEKKLISFKEESKKENLCEPCLKGRQTRLPFEKEEIQHSKRTLEMVHSDICGPITPCTHDNKKYILTFIDDYSHFAVVYLLENKTEVLKCFKKYVSMAEAQFGTNISRIRCDNGKEYDNTEFKEYCSEKGIKIEFTISYTPQQNGVSERFNRTVVEKARTLLADATTNSLGKELWGEAVYASTYIINRLPTRRGIIPAETWYGKSPDYSKIQTFGIEAHVHLTKQQRERGKFEEKSKKYYMIGYCDNGYRLWDPKEKKVIRARDVIFNNQEIQEKERKLTRTESQNYENEESDTEEDTNNEEKKELRNEEKKEQSSEEKKEQSNEEKKELRNEEKLNEEKERRTRKQPTWLKDYETFHCALSCMEEPRNLTEALESPEKEQWKEAINKELESHKKHNTWTLVEKPKDKKVIDSRWVFRKKEDTYKARLVAKGFQSTDYEETYSPVGRLTTLRSLLVIANKDGLEIEQMDVKTAFLHGQLQEEIYMNLPEERGDLVCKLNRSIYGLKQSPRCWNQAFHDFICKKNFKCSDYDNCLYINSENSVKIFVFLYVDDILLISKCKDKISALKIELGKQFEMVSLGPVKKFLGIEVERDYEKKVLKLHQRDYIQKVIQKFKMEDCKTVSTPCEVNLKLEKPEEYSCSMPYRELIGCLIYLVVNKSTERNQALINCVEEEHKLKIKQMRESHEWAKEEHLQRMKEAQIRIKNLEMEGELLKAKLNNKSEE